MIVQLTYFKLNGSYYTDGTLEVSNDKAVFEIHNEVRAVLAARNLPGLRPGHSLFLVHVDVPDHPHNFPVLIVPEPEP